MTVEQTLLAKLFSQRQDWTSLSETDGGAYLVTEIRTLVTVEEADLIRKLRAQA
jgi:hypothetical protein